MVSSQSILLSLHVGKNFSFNIILLRKNVAMFVRICFSPNATNKIVFFPFLLSKNSANSKQQITWLEVVERDTEQSHRLLCCMNNHCSANYNVIKHIVQTKTNNGDNSGNCCHQGDASPHKKLTQSHLQPRKSTRNRCDCSDLRCNTEKTSFLATTKFSIKAKVKR